MHTSLDSHLRAAVPAFAASFWLTTERSIILFGTLYKTIVDCSVFDFDYYEEQTKYLTIHGGKGLICSVCQFPWCKFSHHSQF